MNNEIRKTVMKKTRLRNTHLKDKYAAIRRADISQRNLYVSIVRKATWDQYNNLDNKSWLIMKLFGKLWNRLLQTKELTMKKITYWGTWYRFW